MKENLSAYFRLKCFLGLMLLPFVLSAQNISFDSPEEILKQRQEVFRMIKALEDPFEDSLWYRGRIYEFELRSQIGTPYFFNIRTLPGSLTFNGKSYEDLILSYNLVMDELILLVKVSNLNMIQIVLNKNFVERFTLSHYGSDYHFRLHRDMDSIHNQLDEGFYEVVYDDELRMFVKHKKELFFDASKTDHYSYRDKKQVYLILAGKIHVIDSRRDYLKAFQDYKKSLRKYMREVNIKFENSGTEILFDLCAYSKALLDQ